MKATRSANPVPISFTRAILLTLLALPACSTLGEKGCKTIDWSVQGQLDAEKGHPRVSRFEELRQECSKYSVEGDLRAYTVGYETGVKYFCTPANGWAWGAKGESYHQTCTPDLEPKFLETYRLGLQRHSLAQTISARNHEADRLHALLGDPNVNPMQRMDAHFKMSQLRLENSLDEIKAQELEKAYGGRNESR